MRIFDLITKKKRGIALTSAEIKYMVNAFVSGEVKDYQMAAMLMAIYFQGMNDEELANLTKAMAQSGEMIDLSLIKGKKVDKHSTGGVGDKTTLVIGPIVAACGGKVAKMSGRGLGHTGGTIDKLESIPGFHTSLSKEDFSALVNKIGVAITGQTGNLAPADKKIYALRDVTATVDSLPLIASSIMSKKLAAGSDCILLDVKAGSGAFMKTLADAVSLAEKMVAIGEKSGRKTAALVTDMDVPLGRAIGNSLEVIEAVEVMQGKGENDLTEICLQLAANMLYLIGKGNMKKCYDMAKTAIKDGSALEKFKSMVKAQGGGVSYIENIKKFSRAKYAKEILADKDGFIVKMNAEQCGLASVILGAGRTVKDEPIDYTAGIKIAKKYGEPIKKGDILAQLFTSKKESLTEAENMYKNAIVIDKKKPPQQPLIFARVEKDKVEKFC